MEQQFEASDKAIEQDIERLGNLVRNAPEKGPGAKKEILREVLRSELAMPPVSATQGNATTAPTKKSGSMLPAYLDNAPPEIRLEVEQAVDIAFHKGLFAGARNAEKKGTFFLKAFHDALTDRLYELFRKKGIVP